MTITTPNLAVSIERDGAMSIRAAGMTLGGQLAMADASAAFGQASADLGPSTFTPPTQAGNIISHAQHFASMSVDFSIEVVGEDISIRAFIANHGKQTLAIAMFTPFAIQFAQKARGNIWGWHPSYWAAQGPQLLHPSPWNRVGGYFATDGLIGIGLSTRSHLCKRAMFHASQAVQQDYQLPDMSQDFAVQFIAELNLAPRSATRLDFTIRISGNCDRAHLLENYRAAYRAQLPTTLLYATDARPWGQYVMADRTLITARNPLGFYKEPQAHPDHPGGAAWLLNNYLLPFLGIGQGVIHWWLAGYNTRNAEFRPDHDCFPEEVRARLPEWALMYQTAGLRFGLCSRPVDMIWPTGYSNDDVVRLSPNNAEQRGAVLSRYAHSNGMGFNAYYLDSCGADLESFQMIRALRSALGPDVPTFAELSCDLILPYSGLYTETAGPAVLAGVSIDTREIYRWLFPACSIIAKERSKWPLEEYYHHQLSPLVEAYQLRDLAPAMRAHNATYLDASWQWK